MRFNAATTLHRLLALTGFSLPLTLLVLSACGGGGGGGSLTPSANFNSSGTGVMVSTVAGAGSPGADGIGAAARFAGPLNSVSDGINLYVADTGNHTIRRIAIATGAVSTLAGQAGVAGAADGFGSAATFNSPTGITIDSSNTNLYVVDSGNNKIRRVAISSGLVASVTGTANAAVTAGAADGTGTAAAFNNPRAITTDGITLFVADTGNQKIRRVDISTGTVSSLTGAASSPSATGSTDGANFVASFNSPAGIAIDSTKTVLYVADTGNNKIRSVSVINGATTSFTGVPNAPATAGDVEGPAGSATFNLPRGIAADTTNLYVADTGNNKIRQIVINTGAVSSLTGASGVPAAAGSANGTLAAATFSAPSGITVLGSVLYVADTGNNLVRSVGLVSGQVSTLAGSAVTFKTPKGVVAAGTNLYVADSGNNTIRQIALATGAVTTLAGQSGVVGAAEGTGAAATFNQPAALATDGVNLYVADSGNNKIRKIVIATGAVSSLTGASGVAVTAGAADGAAASAAFSAPAGIATDGTNLYVTDSGNNKIRAVVISTGAVSSLTGAPGAAVTAGAADGAGASATFSAPFGIALDSATASLYVADTGNNKLRRVVIAGAVVSSVTGAASTTASPGAADGGAAGATLNQPRGIATDGVNLYVADSGNNKIRQVTIAGGQVSSVTGPANTAGTAGTTDGTPAAARFFGPYGIIAAGAALYVADTQNNSIRRIQ